MDKLSSWKLPVFLSILTHLLVFNYLKTFSGQLLSNQQRQAPPSKTISVTQVSPERLRRIKNIGKKGGKPLFNVPLPRPNPITKKAGRPQLDLSSLQHKEKLQKKEDLKARIQDIKKERKRSVLFKRIQARRERKRSNDQRLIKKELLKALGQGSKESELVKKTGLDIKFETPEGVEESELNSTEKIYYSFQKRNYIAYVQSFVKSYSNALLKVPRIKTPLSKEKHTLSGRIIFDKFGNIVSIKIIQSSKNDDVHKLFEDTLLGIVKMPNPPKDFLKSKDQFTIYYQLAINPGL